MEGESCAGRRQWKMRSQPDFRGQCGPGASKPVDFLRPRLFRAENAAASARGKSAAPMLNPEEVRERQMKLMEDAHPVTVLIQGTAAGPLIGDVIYFLALCKQEQAERLQWHIDYEAGRGKAARSVESKTAQKAWESAAGWWNTYLGAEVPMGTPAAARTNLARARLCLGDNAGARSLLDDLAGELTPLEKTGRLYQAKQIK